MIDQQSAATAKEELQKIIARSRCDAVVSVGIGKDENGNHKVVLNLANDHWVAWPSEINGVKTKVVGKIEALV